MHARGWYDTVHQAQRAAHSRRAGHGAQAEAISVAAALGALAPDPSRAPDRLSARWLLAVAGLGLAAALVVLARAADPPPVFGKYRVPGPRFWIKYAFMRVMLWINHKVRPRRRRRVGNLATL